MTKCKRIIIVGHMGAGKSLLGKTLAEKLGWKHVDTNPIVVILQFQSLI